jgi:dTDP-4-amino-4,6-dideoxygalactose transaminase
VIPVTRPFLPPKSEFLEIVNGIWDRGVLANHGPLVTELEQSLQKFLGVKHVVAVSSGTMALQLAIRALGISGDVATTPFSYVATSSSLVWEGCVPRYIDVDPTTLCISPDQLAEDLEHSRVGGILATHVYGRPCDVRAIQEIGRQHGVPVLFDAAHAFGVRVGAKSLLSYGDASTLSFHATKLFHTGEGGAVVTESDSVAARVRLLRNFGHTSPETFSGFGINGKMAELPAALGLALLPYVPMIIEERRRICLMYDELLGGHLPLVPLDPSITWNASYYPVTFDSEAMLLLVKSALEAENIFPRRYFFPSLETLGYGKADCVPVSRDVASRVLCLPVFVGLDKRVVETIGQLVVSQC